MVLSSDRPMFPVGVNAIVMRDGQLLLGLRRGVCGDGTWGLPGGHLEASETIFDGVARELLEETGLRSRSIQFSNLVNNRNIGRDNGHYLQIACVVDVEDQEPENCEPEKCYEWRWFDLFELPDKLFHAHVQLIRGYISSEVCLED